MNWLNKKTIFIGAGVTLLLGLVLVVGLQFFKETPTIDSPKDPVVLPEDDELEFTNASDMSADAVWDLVTKNREALKSLFYESEVYLASQIDSNKYKEEDDNEYAVFSDDFFKKLRELMIEEKVVPIFNRVTLLKQDSRRTYYIADKDVFDDIYTDSAIAKIGITKEELRVIHATNDKINASVSVSACEEEENCDKKTSFPFELTKVDNTWKISAFQK